MHQFRIRIIKLSIYYAGSIVLFCLIAPILNYPLQFPGEAIKVIQQVFPVFVGFIAAGIRFFVTADGAANYSSKQTPQIKALDNILTYCIFLFGILTACLFFVFGYSGSRWVQPGSGMSLDDLTLLLALLLSLLTGTLGTIVTFAFRDPQKKLD